MEITKVTLPEDHPRYVIMLSKLANVLYSQVKATIPVVALPVRLVLTPICLYNGDDPSWPGFPFQIRRRLMPRLYCRALEYSTTLGSDHLDYSITLKKGARRSRAVRLRNFRAEGPDSS